jgi:hypothetical protein
VIDPLSNVAFNFNLRRHMEEELSLRDEAVRCAQGERDAARSDLGRSAARVQELEGAVGERNTAMTELADTKGVGPKL